MATLVAIVPKNAFIRLMEKTANIYVIALKLIVIILMDAYIRREQFLKRQVCSLNCNYKTNNCDLDLTILKYYIF